MFYMYVYAITIKNTKFIHTWCMQLSNYSQEKQLTD